MSTDSTARSMWHLIEPVHALTYFDSNARAPLAVLGVANFWPGYVLQRAAPLGAVGPAVVTAAFFGFHPRRAAAVLPDGWSAVSPAQALAARNEGVVSVLRPLASGTAVRELADLLWSVAQHADCHGRTLAAANQALPRPNDPLVALWQATTTIREHRGDGHVAVLVARGLTGLQAMQLKVAAGESDGPALRRGRGWGELEWSETAADLRVREWVDSDGVITTSGREVRRDIESATDTAALQPWTILTSSALVRVTELLRPLVYAIWRTGEIPAVNGIGLLPTLPAIRTDGN